MICIVCQSSTIIPSEARQCPVVCLTIPEKEKVMDECKSAAAYLTQLHRFGNQKKFKI